MVQCHIWLYYWIGNHGFVIPTYLYHDMHVECEQYSLFCWLPQILCFSDHAEGGIRQTIPFEREFKFQK